MAINLTYPALMRRSPPFCGTSSPEPDDFPGTIELSFASICAEHLVVGLRLAGLIVIRPSPMRLTE